MSTAEIRQIKSGQRHCGCLKKIGSEKGKQSKLFFRYMDDIFTCVKEGGEYELLISSNVLHRNLIFTMEREEGYCTPFLEMKIRWQDGKLFSAWYRKPTDLGLIMSYHACAPTRYKRNVIEGMVYRIHHATSTWHLFHQGPIEAKKIWEKIRIRPLFITPVRTAMEKFLSGKVVKTQDANNVEKTAKSERATLVLEYRGLDSDVLMRKVRAITSSVPVVFITTKLKSVISNLKDRIPDEFKSRVIYKLDCSGCHACYVGMTSRHLKTCLAEYLKENAPVKQHLRNVMSMIFQVQS